MTSLYGSGVTLISQVRQEESNMKLKEYEKPCIKCAVEIDQIVLRGEAPCFHPCDDWQKWIAEIRTKQKTSVV